MSAVGTDDFLWGIDPGILTGELIDLKWPETIEITTTLEPHFVDRISVHGAKQISLSQAREFAVSQYLHSDTSPRECPLMGIKQTVISEYGGEPEREGLFALN